jgi:superfamily I DNA and/or RNA helicase
MIFVDVYTTEERKELSYFNLGEVESIKQIVKVLINKYKYPKSWFSIISPYLAQIEKL